MAFRFLHIADAHLDSPLRSLALRNPELADLIGNATRRAFTRAVDLCLEEGVDALLVSGDLYDGDQTSMRTALFLGGELKRLDERGIKVFVIRGNHDHLARITKELVLPDSTMVFGGRADVVLIETGHGEVAIHGLSFAQAHASESLLPKYKPPVEGAINIGLMHTSLGGAPGHDPYAPCRVSDLEASGFRYWALGHIHARTATSGRCDIVMPGMLQGRDVNESGPKTASLVTVADDGSTAVEERLTALAQFERIEVDIAKAEDWREIARSISEALEAARSKAVCEHLVARLKLVGSSSLAWRMRRDADLLTTEAIARAQMLGATWIDGLEIGSSPIASSSAQVGPLDELRRSMQGEILSSSTATQSVREAIEDMRKHLPPELRDLLGDSEAAVERLAERLIETGSEEVLARLTLEPSERA